MHHSYPPFVMIIGRIIAATILLCLSLALPAELPPVPVPPENPVTEEKRVLGKILFWDEQLSSDSTVACGSCHIPSAGGADSRQAINPGPDGMFSTDDDVTGSPGIVSLDENGQAIEDPIFGFDLQVTGRAAPGIFISMYSEQNFWDGRADSQFIDPQDGVTVIIQNGGGLESQAVAPILSSVEMGHRSRNWDQVINKLEDSPPLRFASDLPVDMAKAIVSNPRYPALFATAFGDDQITAARIGMAIATYERTLIPDQSPWDLYQAGDETAMTPGQIAGWEDFRDSTVCDNCHQPPEFTDHEFHNIGLRP
ncbi:MAG: cytochrome-c peroxidase, partial [Proteobacteria bacterium]|nr:cytochrome-c peroxidase [Pseudomonadota bacterium]